MYDTPVPLTNIGGGVRRVDSRVGQETAWCLTWRSGALDVPILFGPLIFASQFTSVVSAPLVLLAAVADQIGLRMTVDPCPVYSCGNGQHW